MADCTIIDKLNYILETKDLIKTAIETQDVEVLESDTFRKYSEYITEIRKVASVNGQTGDIVLKTINGQDLVGEGDITIEGGSGTIDLSNYYTKEEINSLIPTIFVQKIIENTNKLIVVDQDGQTSEINFATINGNNILGNGGDITIEGGSGSVAGVESIDVGGVYLNGKLSIAASTESSDNSWRVGLSGEMYDSATDEYYGNGGSMIFGVKSSDNSIIVTDGGSLADLTINPDILGGGSSGGATYTAGDGISISEDNTITNTGVTAINIGNTIEDWTQKTGVVSFYTDWYEGSYDVAIGGTSFFGIKPIDNSIILENAGGTVNGNTRCGIKINENNFKTINGESIIGSGDITIEGGSSSGDGQGLTDIFVNNGKLIGMEENGNWRNEVPFKTINGQTIIGEEGDITIEGGTGTINIVELTQAEYDALTEYADNTFYVITDATETKIPTLQEGWQGNENNYVYSDYTDRNHSVVSRASIGYAYYDDGIEIDVSNTLWGGISMSERIKIAPVSEEQMGFMTPSDKIKLDSLNGGITEETDPVFESWKNGVNIALGKDSFANNMGAVAIGYGARNEWGNGVCIGYYSTLKVNNGVVIGNGITEETYKTNINNTLKGDTSNYAYILDADGNYVKIIDTYYTKTEIDNLIGGVSDKISEINSMI